MRDMPSKTHSPATYPLFNVSMCRKPHSRSHKFPLFNVSANPLTDTLRKAGNDWGSGAADTSKTDGEKRQSAGPKPSRR
jgi:hypothetical protein